MPPGAGLSSGTGTRDVRALLEASFRAALAATNPAVLTAAHLPDAPPDAVIAVGKAAPAMLSALLDRFPGVPSLLIAPRGLDVSGTAATHKVLSGHPVPDEDSVRAADAALALAAGLSAEQRLLVLISGGGSALMAAPWGVTLAQKRALTAALLASGADIGQVNAVRKHLSRVKGGRLARSTSAHITALLLSDVVGDDPATIASGPTVADPSTFQDALAVLDRYAIQALEARAHLERGVRGKLPETPKPGAQGAGRVTTRVIGSGRLMLEAAQGANTTTPASVAALTVAALVPEPNGLMMANTSSLLISFCTARTANCGWLPLSSTTSLNLRPFTPPSALASSSRNCMALRSMGMPAATGPDKSICVPTTISVSVTPPA